MTKSSTESGGKNPPESVTADALANDAKNPKWFRQVLGQYPTGVCVVTAIQLDGQPVAMVVGSFTSVSLNPPLVAFLPDRSSGTWPKIQSAGRFCVNILGADQEVVCRRFASRVADKFEGLTYRLSGSGSPILDGAVAWIDCDIDSVLEAGDHYIVLGQVRELQLGSSGLPLLFFQGGYGRFSPLSLAAPDTMGTITEQLRYVDIARPEMERLAAELSARCIATARVDDEIVIAASAGSGNKGSAATLVGQRVPLMPPTGTVFAAWDGDAEIDDWLHATSSPATQDKFKASLNIVRKRGYSVGLISEAQRVFVSTMAKRADEHSSAPSVDLRGLIQNLAYDPPELSAAINSEIRVITVPVFGPQGKVVLGLTLCEFPKPAAGVDVSHYIDRVLEAAAKVMKRLGGVYPNS